MDAKDTIKAEPLVTTRVLTHVTAPEVIEIKRLTLKRPRAKKIRPVIGDGNTVAVFCPSSESSVAIDVRISINKLDASDGRRRKVPVVLTDGFDARTFIALFDDKDTDFEIKVDNRSPSHDIWMDITYGTLRSFMIKRRSYEIYNTFEDSGHRLRFMTPNRPDGRSFADMFPEGEIGANTKIEIISNRVIIALTAGHIGGKPKAKKGSRKQPSVITVNVKLKKPDRVVRVTIDGRKTVGDLKRLLAKKYAPDADGKEELVFDAKYLADDTRVDASGLRNNSMILAFSVKREEVDKHTGADRPPTKRLIYMKSERVFLKTSNKLGPPLDFEMSRRYAIESFDIELRLKRIPAFLVHAVPNP